MKKGCTIAVAGTGYVGLSIATLLSIAASGNLLKSGDNDSGTEGEIETNCP